MRFSAAVFTLFAMTALAAPPDAAWIERARKEASVTMYTSMQLVDSRPLTEAFEKKYGVKVNLWRASGEKVAQRVVTESRGGRFDVDVVETDGTQMEILHREKQLSALKVPSISDVPSEILPVHGEYAPTRLTLYVMAYNTQLVAPHEVPRSYADLLKPRWAGRLALENEDVPWFASVVKSMGETNGVAYFRRLAAMKPSMRAGHTLIAELVAAGEIEIGIDTHVQGVARLKEKGAPIDWRPLQPAFGQPSSVGVARRAPHPEAARLLADFILSREGQEIIKSRNRVPSSRVVDSPLNKFHYQLIDPRIALDEWDKWGVLWSQIFLGGKAPKREE
ncbi:MAG: extracellular solute-binding protein [Burkholderiales bacterium]|nr:extracellular solute-binding protein [Burkholderiales bacterium]